MQNANHTKIASEVGAADDVGNEGNVWMMNGIGRKLACT
jgi:hypothetical protein